LDWLRQLVVASWNTRCGLLHFSNQLITRLLRVRPLILRLEHDVGVRGVRRHRVRCNFCGTRACEHPLNFRHLRNHRFLQTLLHLDRLSEARSRHTHGLHRKVTLTEAWDELATHTTCQQTTEHDQGYCGRESDVPMSQHPLQNRFIAQSSCAHDHAFLFLHLASDEHGNSCRNKGNGQDHCTQQRHHNGEGHRVEHFAFDAGEGEDRQVYHHDDQLTEDQRPASFSRRGKDLVEAFGFGEHAAMLMLRMSQSTDRVFYNYHGTVDDDAEVECPQTH